MVTGHELAGGIANPPLLRRRRHAGVTGWPPVFHLTEYDHAATRRTTRSISPPAALYRLARSR